MEVYIFDPIMNILGNFTPERMYFGRREIISRKKSLFVQALRLPLSRRRDRP